MFREPSIKELNQSLSLASLRERRRGKKCRLEFVIKLCFFGQKISFQVVSLYPGVKVGTNEILLGVVK